MGPILIFILSLYQLQTTTNSEIVDQPRFDLNTFSENAEDETPLIPPEIDESTENEVPNISEESTESMPYIRSGHGQTEVEFQHPIASVGIDYARNMIVLKFRQDHLKKLAYDEEKQRHKNFQQNFMRWGRNPKQDFMRFGKRQLEEMPAPNSIDRDYFDKDRSERYERASSVRDSRGDNFMRFGRNPKQDFMRFGRNPKEDFMRFGRNPKQDFMRFGRAQSDFMRLGRNPKDDFMRFGRNPNEDFMRFGRNTGGNFMRFGRNPTEDFMRFGRSQQVRRNDKNFMRFGRPENFMRFGRTGSAENAEKSTNFMRFGKMDQNLLQFGKSAMAQDASGNATKPMLQRSDIKEAAKLLQRTEKNGGDESNPMDKAIRVLFSKQKHSEEQSQKSSEEADNGNIEDLDADTDYSLNLMN